MPRKMKRSREAEAEEIPAKKTKLLDEESEEEVAFKINEDFAKRFEHNNKRKELQQLEERYGKGNVKFAEQNGDDQDDEVDDEDSSSDEEEDDDGEFATIDVDAEINDTLNAIRNKDPRVYDEKTTFYKGYEAPATGETNATKEKAMTLKEYHRQNFLSQQNGDEEGDASRPRTYLEEQADVRNDLVKALQDAADEAEASDDDDEDEDTFLKAKAKPAKQPKAPLPDPTLADKDPENYLSNFFAARAWVPTANSRFAHLESDDESEDEKAEAFESAYNLRFEDPATSNATLKTHARDYINEISVRRDEKLSSRKRARERERLEKEEAKAEKEAEKARLRKLKIEQMEDKLEKIRYAAGGGDVDIAEWASILQEDWDDAKFDEEMAKRFGDKYYEGQDEGLGAGSEDEDEEDQSKSKEKKSKLKKPTWEDDIDIKDLVSDFEDDDGPVSLSDDENDNANGTDEPVAPARKKSKTSSKRDRRLIETLAQQSVDLDIVAASSSKKSKAKEGLRFAYRETSPTSFGLTPLDILAADDAQLNELVGLKKLAAFRDERKKAKDRRKLGKKGRLREWRKSTFGNKEGPDVRDWYVGGDAPPAEEAAAKATGEGIDIREGKKKKRKRGKKTKDVVGA